MEYTENGLSENFVPVYGDRLTSLSVRQSPQGKPVIICSFFFWPAKFRP